MAVKCALEGGEMSCQLEDRLNHLESKVNSIEERVNNTYDVVLEIKTRLTTPSPIWEEMAAVKTRVHEQDYNEKFSSEKMHTIAQNVYEERTSEFLRKIAIVVTLVSVLGGFLSSWINNQLGQRYAQTQTNTIDVEQNRQDIQSNSNRGN